jgi:hypothetical protein
LPRVPEGGVGAAIEWASQAGSACGRTVERADRWLRQWPAASATLLLLALLLGAAMMVPR